MHIPAHVQEALLLVWLGEHRALDVLRVIDGRRALLHHPAASERPAASHAPSVEAACPLPAQHATLGTQHTALDAPAAATPFAPADAALPPPASAGPAVGTAPAHDIASQAGPLSHDASFSPGWGIPIGQCFVHIQRAGPLSRWQRRPVHGAIRQPLQARVRFCNCNCPCPPLRDGLFARGGLVSWYTTCWARAAEFQQAGSGSSHRKWHAQPHGKLRGQSAKLEPAEQQRLHKRCGQRETGRLHRRGKAVVRSARNSVRRSSFARHAVSSGAMLAAGHTCPNCLPTVRSILGPRRPHSSQCARAHIVCTL